MQWAAVNGKERLLVGGAINHFIPNPHFDPVSKPGALDEYFRGRNPKGQDTRELFGELEPISPAYRNRDARIALMDTQGMEGAIFLPTLGVGMEQALINDVPAMLAAFRSFNRWMNEDWGFAYRSASSRRRTSRWSTRRTRSTSCSTRSSKTPASSSWCPARS